MPALPAPPRFSENGRSGTRMLIAMPVTLEGTDAAGQPFKESTKTAVINRNGAKVMITSEVALGAKMKLTMGNSKRTTLATVVWIGEKKKDQLEAGVDIDHKGNFWGVQFPDDSGTFQAPVTEPAGVALPPPPPPAAPVTPVVAKAPAPPPPSSPRKVAEDSLKELGGEAINSLMQTLVREAFQRGLAPAIDAALAESKTRMEAACREMIEGMMQEAGQRMSTRVEHYEARLNTGAEKICQTLALRLAPSRAPRTTTNPS